MLFIRGLRIVRGLIMAILGAALVVLPVRAQNNSRAVFQLGRFDGSSHEFASGNPTAPVRVQAGEANAAHQWYAFQPAIEDTGSSAESPNLPRTVFFTLHGAPAAAYTVRVSLLFEHASVPTLRVALNGHVGNFYPYPELDDRMGDGGAVSFPAYSHATISFVVPGSFLHSGENQISFETLAQEDVKQVPDAGLNYDAISMTEGAEEAEMRDTVRLIPTIFYKQRPQGLEEEVDVVVRAGDSPVEHAAVIVHGHREELPMRGDLPWGEETFKVYFPAFAANTRAQIELHNKDNHVARSEQVLQPAKRWTVYIVPHVHLDIGYTDYQAKVSAVQSRIIDEALDLLAIHPDFKFSVDGMWSFQQFLQNRTAADQARAFAALKSQKLFVPAQYSNELTGFASAEALIRSLYPSAQMDFHHDLPLNYANITDVPSYSWSYASILASAGIHEFMAGSNNGRAPVLLRGHLDEDSPFWWQGPDGQKVLFWYSRHYHQMWTLFGLPPLVSAGEQMLPIFLQMYGRPTYKADSVLVYGSQVENTDLYPEQASLAEQWNRKYAFPKLQYAGFHKALTSIASQFHGDLPTVRGDGGPYWEDGVAADAYYAAMERETEARATTAEKLAAIDSIQNPRMAIDRTRFDSLWKNIVLMDEHTWLSSGSYSDSRNDEATVQLALKDSHAEQAHLLTDGLMRHGMADLADLIDAKAGSLIVFNPLNWPRSGSVSVDLSKGMGLIDNVTGNPVVMNNVADRGTHTNRVTFWADNVPAVGYKSYSLRPSSATVENSSPLNDSKIENAFYRVELDPTSGAVKSIYDKQLKREVVDLSSPYHFGQYLYVTTNAAATGAARFVIHKAADGKIVSVKNTPDGITVELQSSDTETPEINTTLTLSNRSKRILFTEDIDKRETKSDEAVYFAFPFAMTHPDFDYEIQNGVVNPARDMYPGAGLDWFSVQHWAALRQNGWSGAILTLDAPLMTFGDITRLSFPTSFSDRSGTIFSYAMNNYWHTNYRAEQGGHFRFRYIFTSGDTLRDADLSRLGWEATTPLEVDEVTPSDKAIDTKRPLNGKQNSFLKMSDPALLLETWKAAEDGRGYILRFVDLGGSARKATVSFPGLSITRAWLDDSVERDRVPIAVNGDGGLQIDVTPHSIITVRIESRATILRPCGRFCGLPN